MKKNKKQIFPFKEISFRASGWMLVFYFGVIKYIKQKYKIKNLQLTGSSGGAIAACGILCDINLDDIMEELIDGNKKTYIFGVCDYVKSKIDIFIHNICHKKLKRNTLNIACTIFEGKKYRTHLFNDFRSVNDICNYLKGSVHMPLFGGIIPYRYNNYNMYDSIITDSHPHTTKDCLKVSWTKSCECGCEKTLNVIRPYHTLPLSWCMTPPTDSLKLLYQHGYYQAKLYFEDEHDDEDVIIIEQIEQCLKDHRKRSNQLIFISITTLLSILFIQLKKRRS
jgi:hypothetical protein